MKPLVVLTTPDLNWSNQTYIKVLDCCLESNKKIK
jgi:hypothetical protein